MSDRKSAEAISPAGKCLRDLVAGLVFAALLLAPLASFAEEGAGNGAESSADDGADVRSRFAGFVDASPHVVIQRAKGNVDANFGIQSGKSNILTSMNFRLGGGVKGPEFESVLGRPRLVVRAAALIPVNESSTIGARTIQTFTPGNARLEYTRFSIEYSTSAVAGLGLEFRVPFWDSELSITPAIESLHLETRYAGRVNLQITQSGTTTTQVIRDKKQITQHYLGPALRIGVPTVVVRGIAIDFFVDTSLLLDVAGTHEKFSDSKPTGESARFSFESGSGLVQVGSGIQIRWP